MVGGAGIDISDVQDNSSAQVTMGESKIHVVIFHALGFSLYFGNLCYEKYYVPTPGSESYAGRWKYLTYLNEILQLVYFTLATFVDVLSWVRKPKKENSFSGLRDFVFAVFAFPTAMHVSVTFWGIYSIDRELIYPVVLDTIIPSAVNHILHTTCSMLMIVEAIITHHKYPTRRIASLNLFLFCLFYYSWMTWLASVMSQWPYHFLDQFLFKHHCAFFCTCFGLLWLFHSVGRYITSMTFSDGSTKLKI